MALIVVPIINDFEVLSFDIMKPEVGPNTSNIRANGNCTLVALIGSPQNQMVVDSLPIWVRFEKQETLKNQQSLS